MEGKFLGYPEREQIPEKINEQLDKTQRRTDELIENARVSRLGAEESIAFERRKGVYKKNFYLNLI